MVAPTRSTQTDLQLIDFHPPTDDLADEVLKGLLRNGQKTLPCKLFYDAVGSELFEDICEQPEYYPTRTEMRILQSKGGEIADAVGTEALVVEPGSGAGLKTRLLLDLLNEVAGYVSLDIDRTMLMRAGRDLAATYPNMTIVPVCADYNRPFELPDNLPPHRRRMLFFPGSTIGNLHPQAAVDFLKRAREWVERGGCMLIGVDTRKSRQRLEAAYNDAAGVTAAFNLNALVHLNRVLKSDFDPAAWRHESVFNARQSRIEMHLISERNQTVHLLGHTIVFMQGESIRTECSYKYDVDDFQQLARQAGLQPRRCWTDDESLFSVHYLEMPAAASNRFTIS